MKRGIAWLLAVSLLSGCAYAARRAQEPAEDLYQLYFTAEDLDTAAGGDAVEAESVQIPELKEMDQEQAARTLVEALLAGPRGELLGSPFPAGVQLLGVEAAGGEVTVDLSSAYGMLSGIGLTLADYCIALTLTQLDGVSSVRVTVRGQELAYRDRQTFTEMDVLLSSTEDVVHSVQAALYFLDEAERPKGEVRRVDLDEGDTQVSALVAAMQAGPEEKGLTSALPEGFTILSAWLNEDICYVNLASSALEELTDQAALQRALDLLAMSLASLDAVGEVRYLVDGEYAGHYGGVSIDCVYPRVGLFE